MLSYSCVVMIPCAEPGGRSLAAEVLRFQRVQSQEEKRKTGVHARESGGARAREAPEGLAVEQFLFLREKRSRIGGDRCSGFVETPNQAEPMKKPRPPKPRTGTQNRLTIYVRATRQLFLLNQEPREIRRQKEVFEWCDCHEREKGDHGCP